MLVSAACSRAQEASHGTRPRCSSSASAPAILSPHGGLCAPPGRTDVGDSLGATPPVSAGRPLGPAAVSAAVARRPRRRAPRLHGRLAVVAGGVACAVALVLPGSA